MAETVGLVQKLIVTTTGGGACVRIGPNPTFTELFVIMPRTSDTQDVIAWKASVINALAAAQVEGREVKIVHQTWNAAVEGLHIEPV